MGRVSHTEGWNIQILITSIQKVDSRALNLVRGQNLLKVQTGLTSHAINNIGIYHSHVFQMRYGIKQLYHHQIPRGGEETIYIRIGTIIFTTFHLEVETKIAGNGIDQVKSTHRCHNIKQCSHW